MAFLFSIVYANFFCLLLNIAVGINYYEYIHSTSNKNAILNPGDRIYFADGSVSLRVQTDGKCILSKNISTLLWRNTANINDDFKHAVLHTDGNFVVYSTNDTVLWSSNSSNGTMNAPFYLFVHNDGYMYIANKNGASIWNAGNVPDVIDKQIFASTAFDSFKLVNIMKTWDESELYCQTEHNSHLASVHSTQDYNEIISKMAEAGATRAWIGLRRLSMNDSLHFWSDGSFQDYGVQRHKLPWTQWNDQSLDGEGLCVQSTFAGVGPDGTWDDRNCNFLRAFLCSIDGAIINQTIGPTLSVSIGKINTSLAEATYSQSITQSVMNNENESIQYWFLSLNMIVQISIAVCICICCLCPCICLYGVHKWKKSANAEMERNVAHSIVSLQIDKQEMNQNKMFGLYPMQNDKLLSPKHRNVDSHLSMYTYKRKSVSKTKGYTSGYQDSEGRDEVRLWLESMSKKELSSYYEYFVNNGFDSLDMIQEIDSIHQLKALGIKKMAHQIVLMKHINHLKWNPGAENSVNTASMYISDSD